MRVTQKEQKFLVLPRDLFGTTSLRLTLERIENCQCMSCERLGKQAEDKQDLSCLVCSLCFRISSDNVKRSRSLMHNTTF